MSLDFTSGKVAGWGSESGILQEATVSVNVQEVCKSLQGTNVTQYNFCIIGQNSNFALEKGEFLGTLGEFLRKMVEIKKKTANI